ncbi:MAG: aldo/keto reductase, partial [Gammaproteobacteria bacterium]
MTMAAESLIRRPIPRTAELLPVIGLGTWQTFDVAESDRAPLGQVLSEFVRLGGKVVDSSPMYGRSESAVGDLAAKLGLRSKLFVATKVWTSGREDGIKQIETSFKRLRVDTMDLLQVHNLLAWEEHLRTLFAMKSAGQVHYVGITTSEGRRHAEVEKIMRAHPLDFVQVSYNVLD